jgi:hypothetical protein
MMLRVTMLVATVVAAGLGLVFAQKYLMEGPDVGLTDREFWKALVGGNDDSGMPACNEELMILGRMSLKDALAHKLVNQEITLQQAATRFVEINKDSKTYFVGLDCNYPDVGLNEAVYRDVLKWTECLYEKDPDYSLIRERLDKEFEECRRQDFPLPAVPLRSRATAE